MLTLILNYGDCNSGGTSIALRDTGTAFLSLDLCAAALGREYGAWKGSRELDLRDFDQSIKPVQSSARRNTLPPIPPPWVDDVLAESRYKIVLGARHPLTHAYPAPIFQCADQISNTCNRRWPYSTRDSDHIEGPRDRSGD